MAVPTIDKPRDMITPMDYQVTTIYIGPSMKQQEFQELNDSAKAIEAQLNRVEEKKEMLEMENMRLKEYIEGLNLLRRDHPTFVSPIAITHGSPNDHEAMRSTY